MKKLIILITLTIFNISKSQEYPPPTDLITIPTAGTLMRGSYSMDMRIQDAGQGGNFKQAGTNFTNSILVGHSTTGTLNNALGNVGVHAGISYNFLEKLDEDTDPNLFFGLDLELNPELSILLEYNSALNENENTAQTMSINSGGYLNAALRWSFVESFYLEFDFNNLLFNDKKVDSFKREMKITYIELKII